MANLTITQEQYEALISLAQAGTVRSDGTINQEKALALESWLKLIEKANNITRYSLWIRWQDSKTPLQPTTQFPRVWPPQLQFFLQFVSRRISKDDVLKVVKDRTPAAVNIMVTKDPAGLVGWQKVDDHFLQP